MKKLVLLLIALGLLLWAVISTSQVFPQLAPFLGSQNNELQTADGPISVLPQEDVVISVVKNVSPSVVTIAARIQETPQDDPFSFFGFPIPEQENSDEPQNIGSGFIVTADGLIVTNKHVVNDAETEYTVITSNEKRYTVRRIYRDPLNDIAILKIDPSQNIGTTLKPVTLGDSEKLQVGQLAIAIGTPLGEFSNTVTTGVISGLGRGITAGSIYEGFIERLDDVIQTDAAISPGNSGGPLLNSTGQVIGVNTAVSISGQNIGFALPINTIKESINNFNQTGQFNRPFLGVSYRMITSQLAIRTELPEGAYIQTVVEGSAADKAGIREGDIITEIDGQKIIAEDKEISTIIARKKVGDKMNLKVSSVNNEGERSIRNITVILEAAPEQ